MRALVKSFNDIRAYGFVTTEDLNEDVFVHLGLGVIVDSTR